IAVNRVGPGELLGFKTPGSITLGEYGRPAGSRARAIAAQFEQAGVPCAAVDCLEEARWRKLAWHMPFNGPAIAAGGLPTDRILADPRLAAEVRALMAEVVQAAAARGIRIPDDFVQGQIDVTGPMGAYKPSSAIDFLAKKPVEVEAIWGEPLRRAQA